MDDFVKDNLRLLLRLELLLAEANMDYDYHMKLGRKLEANNINLRYIRKIENRIDKLWDKILAYFKIKSIRELNKEIYDYYCDNKNKLKPNPNHNYKESYQLLVMRRR